jgi:hypothetical protein
MTKRTASGLALAVLLVGVLALAGCGRNQPQVNVLPEAPESVDVGAEAQGGVADTPEATWESYLADIIAEQVKQRESLVSLLERYQDPAITEQNLGGTMTDIDLVADRTVFTTNASGTLATTTTDFDVRVTYADGDTETRTCQFDLMFQWNDTGGVWYVVNPQSLAVFAVCTP